MKWNYFLLCALSGAVGVLLGFYGLCLKSESVEYESTISTLKISEGEAVIVVSNQSGHFLYSFKNGSFKDGPSVTN